jgi:hypothetical protein
MDDSTQAHCLAKVFNSPKIKYLNKVSILVNKSGVLHLAQQIKPWAYSYFPQGGRGAAS